jgi:hypothetical protein
LIRHKFEFFLQLLHAGLPNVEQIPFVEQDSSVFKFYSVKSAVCHVSNLVKSASFDSFADICHEMIKALVTPFLLLDELHNLYVQIACALSVFLELLDDKFSLLKFVWVKTLSVELLQSAI